MRTLAILAVTLAAACSEPTAGPTARPVDGPVFNLYNPSAPIPQLVSAVRVAQDGTFDTIRLTFVDTAEDETLVSAYVSGCVSFAATQNIGGTPGTGERVVDVMVPTGFCKAKLRYLWNPTPEIQGSATWGAFSNEVAVTDAAVLVALKKKSRK